ncbi:MAG: hypothetical protein E7165_04300 [Firmicutes bacterium]|nr:hypothetical protein [Bacillota bacterium]
MNKEGFTLVELLAIIIILAVILVLIVPSITGVLKDTRETAYNKQITVIENAAKKWGTQNGDKLPDIGSKQIITIDFGTLKNEKFLTSDQIINPKTEKNLTGCVKIYYNNEYNQYEYKYTDNLSDCSNYNINNLKAGEV